MFILFLLVSLILIPSEYFWYLLFVGIAVCRFKLNRNRLLFISSILLTIIPFVAIFYMPEDAPMILRRPLVAIVIIQCSLAFFSFGLNTIQKYWKRDYAFYFMELFLAFTLLYYFRTEMRFGNLMDTLHNWLLAYIIVQSIFVLYKIGLFFNIDFIPALAGTGESVVPRQPQAVVQDELNLLLARTKAVVTFDYHKVRQLNKELAKHRENHYILNRSGTKNGNGHAAKKAATATSNGKNGNRTANPKNGTPKDSGYDDDAGKDMRRAE